MIKRWDQENNCSPSFPLFAAGVYTSAGRLPIIPIFHHSITPIAERSGAKLKILPFFGKILRVNQGGIHNEKEKISGKW